MSGLRGVNAGYQVSTREGKSGNGSTLTEYDLDALLESEEAFVSLFIGKKK